MSRTVAAWQPLFLNILAAAETMSSSVAIRPSSPVQPAQDLRFPGGPPSALMQAQRVAEKEGSPAGRLLFLDNLRLTIIILVIGMHAVRWRTSPMSRSAPLRSGRRHEVDEE